jgi:hypothetical protein
MLKVTVIGIGDAFVGEDSEEEILIDGRGSLSCISQAS